MFAFMVSRKSVNGLNICLSCLAFTFNILLFFAVLLVRLFLSAIHCEEFQNVNCGNGNKVLLIFNRTTNNMNLQAKFDDLSCDTLNLRQKNIRRVNDKTFLHLNDLTQLYLDKNLI